jgi:MFS family permease
VAGAGSDGVASAAAAEEGASSVSSRDRWYASIVAFLAWTLSVYDYILFGTLLPLIAKDFGWSVAQSTLIATWVSVGTLVTSFLVGPLTDYLGRRMALIFTTAAAAVSSGLAALTFHPIYLICVRSLSGFGYSEQAVNTTYLSELYGPARRGFLYSFVQGGWPIGVLFAAAVAAISLPFIGWRGVFAVATFPLIVIFLLGLRLKESPRFERMREVRRLAAQGRTREASRLATTYGLDVHRTRKLPYIELLAPDVRRHTIFVIVAFFLNWTGGIPFAILGTTTLTQGKGLTFTNSLLLLILSNALAYVGYVVHGYLGDRIGRRDTVACAWILCAVSYLIMLFAADGFWPVLVTYSIGLFFEIGAYSALFSYLGESYPTHIRGTGAAFANAMGPIGAIAGTALFTALLSAHLAVVNAAAFSGVIPIFLSGVFLFGGRRIPPGRTLEELAVQGAG